MVLKVAIPGKIQFKMVHRDQKFLMTRQGDIHYIGCLLYTYPSPRD